MPYRIDFSSLSSFTGRAMVYENQKDAHGRHAFSLESALSYTFYLPRLLGLFDGSLSLFCDKTGECVARYPLVFSESEGENDLFTCALAPLPKESGLYFCRLSFSSPYGEIDAEGGNEFHFVPKGRGAFVFQLTLSDFAYAEPAWLKGGVIYHVFVDRFCRGAENPVREGAILNEDWENGMPQYPEYPGAPLANNMFFGGDLAGVEKKLSYIASLGVTCIYLSPIFRAYSNHKYDTGDYMEIDEMFGGRPAFLSLLEKAKTYGIRIVLDGVFNHTGDDSRYFNRRGSYDTVGAYQSKDSPYYPWFTFRRFPDEYEAWWNIEILPRLNTENASCRDYFLGENGVIATYAALGIGGMRLDVADELSSSFIQGIKKRLTEKVPDAVLYGEVWEDASNKIAYDRRTSYYYGRELDGVMNYPLRTGLISYLRHKKTDALSYYFNEVLPNMPKRAADLAMNLLGTHDTLRILTALGGKAPDGYSNEQLASLRMTPSERKRALRLLAAAYTVLATLPGVPSIYYADEVGAEGYSDPFNRMPFPWGREDEDLLAHYRAIGALRKNEAYREGELRILCLTSELLIFAREGENANFVTVYNNSQEPLFFKASKPFSVLMGLESDAGVLAIEGETAAVLRVERGTVLYRKSL